MSVSKSTASGHAIDCDSVVEALVREHLTKKQYNSTLAAFQQEQVGANCVWYGFGWLKSFQSFQHLGCAAQPVDWSPSSCKPASWAPCCVAAATSAAPNQQTQYFTGHART
jgi:hypothetical protein